MAKEFQKHVFLSSLLITIAIFSIGVITSYLLDYARVAEVTSVMDEHELDTAAYVLNQQFLESFGGNKCDSMISGMYELKKEIVKVGTDLSNYGSKSIIFRNKDFDYLKRKYFLLELKFYSMINNLNDECGKQYIPILFFYEIDDPISERQGYILDDLSQGYRQQIAVITIDKDYEDEPLVKSLVDRYQVTTAPTLVIDNDMIINELIYTGELNATILKILRGADPHAGDIDFRYVLRESGVNESRITEELKSQLAKNISGFAKGDITLVLGRITQNDSLVCSSLQYYDSHKALNDEEQALLYETYASLGCGRNREIFLTKAAELWDKLGVHWRADLDRNLRNLTHPQTPFAPAGISSSRLAVPENASRITIGRSYFNITSSDILVSQADRVNRDWLGATLNASPHEDQLLKVLSERLSYPDSELRADIGWHEGGRISQLTQIGLTRKIGAGTMVAKINGSWYAPNEKGEFMFDVPIDKVSYPTTRFLSRDIAVIIDTHGINMLVEQALRNNATLVIGCGDNVGKVKAAQYLSERGVKIVTFTDKYASLAMGSGTSLLGSPPFRRKGPRIIMGDQPINISLDEPILALEVPDITKVQSYYDTPSRYFRKLQESLDLDVSYFPVTHMNQLNKMIEFAKERGIHVVAARVFNSNDYYNLKGWLEEDSSNRAILFHTEPYPYGHKILREFTNQTTFGDISPLVT